MAIAQGVFWILVTMAGIMVACEAFTNSIEWLGKKLNLSEGAVGSVLAAIGTALPETIIPIIAIASAWKTGKPEGTEIGMGAIVGAPFMLSTLALFVTGAAITVFVRQGRRTEHVRIDPVVMKRDLRFFLIAYAIAILSSFIPSHSIKIVMGLLLLVAYGYYVHMTLQHPGELGEDMEPLYFARAKEEPSFFLVVAQVAASLGGILLGSHFFVGEVRQLSQLINMSPLILSLVITPIATELPEKFNSVLWVRARKDTLALGNITGAMVFQSCIPTAVGLVGTPWIMAPATFLSAAIALISAGLLYFEVNRRNGVTPLTLMVGGIFYSAFLIGIFGFHLKGN